MAQPLGEAVAVTRRSAAGGAAERERLADSLANLELLARRNIALAQQMQRMAVTVRATAQQLVLNFGGGST